MNSKPGSGVLAFLTGIGFYAIPFIARSISNLVVVPVYTHYLTPSDYGVLELLDLTSFLVGILIGTNFGQSLFYYYAAAKTDEARGEAVATSFYGSLILAAVSIVFGVALATPLGKLVFGVSAYAPYMRVVFATLAFAFPAEVGLSCLRALDMPKVYSIVSLGRLVVSVGANIVLLMKFHLGFAAMLWGSFTVTLATAIFLAWFNREWLRFPFRWKLFMELVKYAWPLNISGLATLALDLGDRYVLKRWVSLDELGIYGLAYKFGLIVSMASLIFNQFWKPKMFAIVREEGGEWKYTRVCTYYTFALAFVAVGIAILTRPLFRLAVGPSFLVALQYIPWIASIYVIRLLSDFSRNAFYLKKRTGKEAQITWAAAAVCIAGYLALIPVWKLWGAIAATGISFAVMFFVSFWQAQKVWHFDFEYKRLAAIGGCAAAIMALYPLVEPSSLWLQIAEGIAAVLLFPVALFAGGFLRDDERAALRSGLSMARTKWKAVASAAG